MVHRRGFTLTELLIVIAVIAILATAVLVVLNPTQLLAQQRDSNRVDDMNSLGVALAQYQAASNGSMGAIGTVYISIPDPAATTTFGDQCQGLGLPTSTAFIWHCAASSTYRNADGTGWIPVNLKALGAAAAMTVLPVDPANTTSSYLFYSYSTDGQHFEVNALPESAKQKLALATTPILANYPDVIAAGSSPSSDLLFNPTGLVGYWNLDEGSGTVATDGSGNKNTGLWTSSGYTSGKIGPYAGNFNGSTGFINTGAGASTNLGGLSAATVSAWVQYSGNSGIIVTRGYTCVDWGQTLLQVLSGKPSIMFANANSSPGQVYATGPSSLTSGNWYLMTGVLSSSTITLYINGQSVASSAFSGTIFSYPTDTLTLGASQSTGGCGSPATTYYHGAIDDVRVYTRALSAPEVYALYSAGK